MASLTSPITTQNIVDRFADYVRDTANANISWGTNSVPFSEMSTSYFGGTTTGKTIGITGSTIGATGDIITASQVYNVLLAETKVYTSIRNLRAILFVDGGGGNTGSRPTPGTIYDSTAVAYLNTGYQDTSIAPSTDGAQAATTVSELGLETLFGNMRNAYNTVRGNTVTVQINVCHASCHSSCHGSRGRR